MVSVINKETTKKELAAMLKRMRDRQRKRRAAKLMALCGSAPLHTDPVGFQRALQDE